MTAPRAMDTENVAPQRTRVRAPGKRARGLGAHAPGKATGAPHRKTGLVETKAPRAPRPRRALGDITNNARGGNSVADGAGVTTGKSSGKETGKRSGNIAEKGADDIIGELEDKGAKLGLEESGWEVEDVPKGAGGAVAWAPPSLVDELLGGDDGKETEDGSRWNCGLERGPLDELPRRLEKEEFPFVACDADGRWDNLEIEDEDGDWVGADVDLSMRIFELPPISFGDDDESQIAY